MNELPKRGRRGSRPTTSQAGQAGEHGVGLLESNVLNLAAVPRVPAQRRPAEPSRVIDHEEDELERLGKAHEVELGRGRVGDGRIAAVERAAEAAIGRALRGHERMFACGAIRVRVVGVLGRGLAEESSCAGCCF